METQRSSQLKDEDEGVQRKRERKVDREAPSILGSRNGLSKGMEGCLHMTGSTTTIGNSTVLRREMAKVNCRGKKSPVHSQK